MRRSPAMILKDSDFQRLHGILSFVDEGNEVRDVRRVYGRRSRHVCRSRLVCLCLGHFGSIRH